MVPSLVVQHRYPGEFVEPLRRGLQQDRIAILRSDNDLGRVLQEHGLPKSEPAAGPFALARVGIQAENTAWLKP